MQVFPSSARFNEEKAKYIAVPVCIIWKIKDNARLAELVAANAAYATISKFVKKDREISDALAPLKNLVGAEEELKARGNRKKDGLFSKVMGKSADDFDEFLAPQQIAEKRKELIG